MPLQRAYLDNSENEADILEGQNPFTVAAITAIYSSPFAQGFSNDQCQAAIRAILQHSAHEDSRHYLTKSQGDLHLAYAGFNPVNKSENKVLSRTDLVEASLSNVFDVVGSCHQLAPLVASHSMLDHLARPFRWWNLYSH